MPLPRTSSLTSHSLTTTLCATPTSIVRPAAARAVKSPATTIIVPTLSALGLRYHSAPPRAITTGLVISSSRLDSIRRASYNINRNIRPGNPSSAQRARPHSSSTQARDYHRKDVKMADRTHRVTMFKLPNKEQQAELIAAYKVLSAEQQRDGKPYILSLVVGPALEDPRSKGYTLVAKTEFASLEDMRYYDDHCTAHTKLKGLVRGFGLGPEDILSIYFEPGHVATL